MSDLSFGLTYEGIPVYLDKHMDRDRVLIIKKQGGKPDRNQRVSRPQIKGLILDQVKAFVVHPDMANRLESALIEKSILGKSL